MAVKTTDDWKFSVVAAVREHSQQPRYRGVVVEGAGILSAKG